MGGVGVEPTIVLPYIEPHARLAYHMPPSLIIEGIIKEMKSLSKEKAPEGSRTLVSWLGTIRSAVELLGHF